MKGYLVILNYQTTTVTLRGLCLNSYSKIITFNGSLSFTVIHLRSFKKDSSAVEMGCSSHQPLCGSMRP